MGYAPDDFPFDGDTQVTDDLLMAASLRGARALAGLSQGELAGLFGTSRQVLAKAERGEDIANFFEVASSVLGRYDIDIDVGTERVGVWRTGWRDRSSGEEMDPDHRAGILLEAARSAADMTQRQLAAASGVSLRTIVSMEQGKSGLEAVRDAVATALHRRRVDVVSGKDRLGINILSDRVTPQPIDVTFMPDGNSAFARINRELDASADVNHPSFVHYRIEIEDTVPRIWREILIPENATFEDLHRTIQAGFGWRDRHLHKFELGIDIGPVTLNEGGSISEGHVADERLIWLHDVSHRITAFRYVYDFGDKWRHTIVRGNSVRAEGRPCRPLVIDGAQAGPVEDSGSSEGYNELARKLRRKSLDKDEGNWLQRRGYGRDYDPDAFDVGECNEALAALDFDIPSTWMEQHNRRKLVVVSAPFLRDRTQDEATSPAPLAVRQVRLLSVEKFGEDRFDEEGTGVADEGWGMVPSAKMDRAVTMRSPATSLLPDLLETAPDVAYYSGFPIRVSYEADGKKAAFFPDAEVTFTDGNILLVHTLWEDDIPFLNVYEKLQGKLRESGVSIVFLPSGCMDDPQCKTAKEIRRHSGRWAPQEPLVDDLLQLLVARRPMSVRDAVTRLLEAGHGNEGTVVGGKPEGRALVRLLGAVSRGLVSIDMFFDEPIDSVIGPPGLFDDTASFQGFVERCAGQTGGTDSNTPGPKRKSRRS